MKKLILISSVVFTISCNVTAQTSTSETGAGKKFTTAMETSIAQLDTANTPATFMTLANNFDRIATTEKTRWEPFYYAAYCYAVMAVSTPDKTKIDMLADKAELYLTQADNLQKNNSEVSALFAMIKSSKVMVDPMSRWQTLSKEITQHLAEAKQQDNTNPRPYLIEARIKYNTPEAMGGGKQVAKTIITEGIKKFADFKTANKLAPKWGLASAQDFLNKLEVRNNQ